MNLEVLWAIYNFETSVVTCKDRPERGSTTLHRTRALEQHAVRLEQSEEKYRTVFAQANDAIEVVDEDGRFIDCNQKACEMFGYTREELLSKRLWEVVPPEFRDGIRARMTRVMEGGSEPL
ncbi:MAG: PAS domain S-box protein, partial [Nitrospinota bacterium]|nr:PAS domain S-box protein [Nitrospinota bacterium]